MSPSCTALGFFLNGVLYPNNSVVDLTAIGTDDRALFCFTNLTECCRNSDTTGDGSLGDWKRPDQSKVFGLASVPYTSTYRTRRPSAVTLHRRDNAMEPTGVFTCEVPDAEGVDRSLYIFIHVGQAPGTYLHMESHFYRASVCIGKYIVVSSTAHTKQTPVCDVQARSQGGSGGGGGGGGFDQTPLWEGGGGEINISLC